MSSGGSVQRYRGWGETGQYYYPQHKEALHQGQLLIEVLLVQYYQYCLNYQYYHNYNNYLNYQSYHSYQY